MALTDKGSSILPLISLFMNFTILVFEPILSHASLSMKASLSQKCHLFRSMFWMLSPRPGICSILLLSCLIILSVNSFGIRSRPQLFIYLKTSNCFSFSSDCIVRSSLTSSLYFFKILACIASICDLMFMNLALMLSTLRLNASGESIYAKAVISDSLNWSWASIHNVSYISARSPKISIGKSAMTVCMFSSKLEVPRFSLATVNKLFKGLYRPFKVAELL